MESTANIHSFAGREFKFSVWSPANPVMICKDDLVGIDSETTLIKNKYTWPDVVVAGFCSEGECQLVEWRDLPAYLPLFLKFNPTVKLVFFNLPFDVNVMGREVLLEELKKDGRMMELAYNYRIYLIGTQGWIPGRITLYDVTLRTLNVKLNKEDGTRTSFNRETALTEQQIRYLIEDCAATYLCGKAYNNLPSETDQARASFVLSEISHNGMLVDRESQAATAREVASKMPELEQILKTYGLRLKQETDDMTGVERFCRMAEMAGVIHPEFALHDVKSIGRTWWIILAALLHGQLSEGGCLISSLEEIFITVIRQLVGEPEADKETKKQIKDLKERSSAYLASALTAMDCSECLYASGGKHYIVMCECMMDNFKKGLLLADMKAFEEDFKDLHDYNLGWLNTGSKPLTPTKFIQKHLRDMMRDHPGLTYPLTDGAKKAIKKYTRQCMKKVEPPDPAEIDKLSAFQCKGQDMWMLTDLGLTDPFMDAYVDYKHREKLLSTYLTDKYVDGDGRVHPKYSGFLATGRTGCSAPNLQNLPKEHGLREQYIPAEGCVLCSCDFGQEEIVTLAATLLKRYGKSRLAEAVNAGVDVHSFFSLYREGKLNDLDLSEFTPELVKVLKERSKFYKEDPEGKHSRSLSKIFNFGRT